MFFLLFPHHDWHHVFLLLLDGFVVIILQLLDESLVDLPVLLLERDARLHPVVLCDDAADQHSIRSVGSLPETIDFCSMLVSISISFFSDFFSRVKERFVVFKFFSDLFVTNFRLTGISGRRTCRRATDGRRAAPSVGRRGFCRGIPTTQTSLSELAEAVDWSFVIQRTFRLMRFFSDFIPRLTHANPVGFPLYVPGLSVVGESHDLTSSCDGRPRFID